MEDNFMVRRTILSFSEEALQEADQLASELHVSRAELFRRAVVAYADEIRRKKEEEEIQRQRREAVEGIARLREEFSRVKDPNWDPVKVIREWRDRDIQAIHGRDTGGVG